MELAAAAAGAPPPLAVAVTNYGALPMDVLFDILLRLPADEVCRLRLVCRAWRSLTSDRLFARAYSSHHQAWHVIVVDHHDGEAVEVRAVDLHGSVIKRMQIRRPIGRLSVHGDLLCASHGWSRTCAVDMVTGDFIDVAPADHRIKKVNGATPKCVLGHVPATGEYKVLRIQADYCSRRRQACEVMTLAGGGGSADTGRWRRLTPPPVTLSIEPWSSSWNMAVVAGVAYFLVRQGPEDKRNVEADSIAVFDLAKEEWEPEMIRGPLTSSLVDSKNIKDKCSIAALGDSLVVVYRNVMECSTELWFLEDMEEDDTAAPGWSRRYTLQCTPTFSGEVGSFVHSYGGMYSVRVQQHHYPLAVLDDGRILVWVEKKTSTLRACKTSALRSYDPETSVWTDLATLTGGSVVGIHHGSLLCSNITLDYPEH